MGQCLASARRSLRGGKHQIENLLLHRPLKVQKFLDSILILHRPIHMTIEMTQNILGTGEKKLVFFVKDFTDNLPDINEWGHSGGEFLSAQSWDNTRNIMRAY